MVIMGGGVTTGGAVCIRGYSYIACIQSKITTVLIVVILCVVLVWQDVAVE